VLFPLKETPLVGDVKRLAATELVDNTYRALMSLVTSFGQSLDGRSIFCTLDESSSAQSKYFEIWPPPLIECMLRSALL
jgi:hypothetical protein